MGGGRGDEMNVFLKQNKKIEITKCQMKIPRLTHFGMPYVPLDENTMMHIVTPGQRVGGRGGRGEVKTQIVTILFSPWCFVINTV